MTSQRKIKDKCIYLVTWKHGEREYFSIESVDLNTSVSDIDCTTIHSNAHWMKNGDKGTIPMTKEYKWYEIDKDKVEDVIMIYSI